MNTNYATTFKCEMHQCTNCGEMFSPKLSLKLLKKDLLQEIKKYLCDFNYDFEKGKAKHTSYIKLADIIKLLKRV